MNRDESLTRPAALPPQVRREKGCAVVSPSEPGGGTWISVNDRGVTFALINWYAIEAQPNGKAVSRGIVVRDVASVEFREDAEGVIQALPLDGLNPFRLIGFFPLAEEIREWRWDQKSLTHQRHPWRTQQWISSGFDEPAAQRVRQGTFLAAQLQRSAGTLGWLRRLHQSHRPEKGPCSHCMHRTDAQTVSYTEIVVSPRRSIMRYQAGPPCQDGSATEYILSPRPN
jgi:hypothetical protein